MEQEPIRVLIANDSPSERELLIDLLNADPQLLVVAVAGDGKRAVELACQMRPDVISMDVHMPRLDGLEATRQIMERCPTRVVIVTASASYLREGEKAFRALEMGALILARTPPGREHPDHSSAARELVEAIKSMAEVKVVHRWARKMPAPEPPPESLPVRAAPISAIAIGASAGGPLAIQYLLANLPETFPVPLLIVQHIAPGFLEGFATWLQQATALTLRIATDGEVPLPGHVYLAPSERHMGVDPGGRIVVADAPPEAGLRPAISYLLRSVDAVWGRRAVGVLLSGMGQDGAAELKLMRRRGAITIVQDRASATVYGIQGEAVRLGAVSFELPLQRIPGLLIRLSEGGTP